MTRPVSLCFPLRPFLLFTCVAFPLATAPAAAEEGIHPYAGYSISYDDNVLRFNNDAVARAVTGGDDRSDTIQRAEAGINVDTKLGQQAVVANLNYSHQTYANFDRLNHDGINATASWNWRLGTHLEGDIGASYVKMLAPFVDFHLPERNVRTLQREFADALWQFHPSWRLRTGIANYTVRYDLPVQQTSNRDDRSALVGIDFLPSTGSAVGVQFRRLNGSYPNVAIAEPGVVDNDFRQNEFMARVDWNFSGKTRLHFLGGLVRRKHEGPVGRNFSGFNARTTVDWAATGKTSVTASAWREVGNYDDLTAMYSINQGISIAPRWDASEKIKVTALLKRETRDFNTNGGFATNSRDTFRYVSLTVGYAPLRKAQLGFSVFSDQKSSRPSFNSYRAKGALVSANYQF